MGAATARRLAEEGAKVVVGDINLTAAQTIAREIEQAGGNATALEYDQANEDSIASLVAGAVEHFGALHGLHTNAADLSNETLGRDGDLLEMDLAIWDRTLQVNLIGYALLIRAAVPHLLAAGGGGIVCTCSGSATAGEPTRPAYACSKAAVGALVRHVASRWGKERIRCNAVSPGQVWSEKAYEFWREQLGDDFKGPEHFPLPRTFRGGQPEDIAAAVTFLLADDSEWINGQILGVNGGSSFEN